MATSRIRQRVWSTQSDARNSSADENARAKIDSRTILGEGGAEQLLGRGDMLYMAGGGRVTRVHGPFVSDEEVERVVSFWKNRGDPDYIDEITEDDEAPLDPLGERGG